MNGSPDIIFIAECHEGLKAKLLRVSRGLRQGDIAFMATGWLKARGWPWKVQVSDVGCLERGQRIPRMRQLAILNVLGLSQETGVRP